MNNKIPGRDHWDRNRGIQSNSFADALKKAAGEFGEIEQEFEGGIRRVPGTDIADPYGSLLKPKNVPVWEKPPMSDEEETIYFGLHIHSESNPLGLHSHVPGGKPGGGHSHGPQNRFGSHHHKKDVPIYGISLDGSHVHDGENAPAGSHNHCPDNFG